MVGGQSCMLSWFMVFCFPRIVSKDSACFFPAKSVKNCILHSFARRIQIKAKACFAKYFYVHGFQSSSALYIFLFSLFYPSLVIPIRLHFEWNLFEFCLHCQEKEKRPKRLFPSALAQAILLPSVIPVGCTKFFLQRFMGASSIVIKKAIRYLTDVSGHPWHTHEAKA